MHTYQQFANYLFDCIDANNGILTSCQSLYDDGAETTRKQLLSACTSLEIASDETVDKLLDKWKTVVNRIYSYYQYSASSYFTYLRLHAKVQ